MTIRANWAFWHGAFKEKGAKMKHFRKRVNRGGALRYSMMCVLNIKACLPDLVDYPNKSMNVKISIIWPF